MVAFLVILLRPGNPGRRNGDGRPRDQMSRTTFQPRIWPWNISGHSSHRRAAGEDSGSRSESGVAWPWLAPSGVTLFSGNRFVFIDWQLISKLLNGSRRPAPKHCFRRARISGQPQEHNVRTRGCPPWGLRPKGRSGSTKAMGAFHVRSVARRCARRRGEGKKGTLRPEAGEGVATGRRSAPSPTRLAQKYCRPPAPAPSCSLS